MALVFYLIEDRCLDIFAFIDNEQVPFAVKPKYEFLFMLFPSCKTTIRWDIFTIIELA